MKPGTAVRVTLTVGKCWEPPIGPIPQDNDLSPDQQLARRVSDKLVLPMRGIMLDYLKGHDLHVNRLIRVREDKPHAYFGFAVRIPASLLRPAMPLSTMKHRLRNTLTYVAQDEAGRMWYWGGSWPDPVDCMVRLVSQQPYVPLPSYSAPRPHVHNPQTKETRWRNRLR